MKLNKIKIAIFCSGSGSNAQKIIEHFQEHSNIEVALLLSNSKTAYALERAKLLNIPSKTFDRHAFYETNEIVEFLKAENIQWIVLAGFLWLIPENLIKAYPKNIINIHPALLPLFGGKGMYGMNVHQAVIECKSKESGISIHYVNQNYDEGHIIFQAKCIVSEDDTAESVAKKVLLLEHKHFPVIIEKTIITSNKNL